MSLFGRIIETRSEWKEPVFNWCIEKLGIVDQVNDGTYRSVGHDIINYIIGIIGLFVALVRMSEPIVWHALCEAICPSRIAMRHEKYDDDSLSSFLNSAMNTEYVILIVGGLQHFFKE